MRYLASLLILLAGLSVQAQWTKQAPPTGNTAELYAVHAIDTNTVAAVGHERIIYSNDGGATWANSTKMSQSYIFNIHWGDNAYFFSYVSPKQKGDGYELKLKPSGALSMSGTGKPTGIYGDWFHSSREGLVCGIDGKVHQTLDGGTTWSKQISTGIGDTLVDFHFPTKSMGYVVGNNGSVAVSGNGGGVWKTLSTGSKENLRGVFFMDQNNGLAVGTNGTILKTTNGGGTWTTKNSGVTSRLNAVALYNANDGYAVGDGGVILETDDGGDGWTAVTSPTTHNLFDIHFASETKGWIVGGASGKEEIILVFGGSGTACTVQKPTAEAKDLSCYGQQDGEATITAVGGVPPYTYSLDGGTYGSTNTFSGLNYGTHYATVIDSAGCQSESVTFNIAQPLPVTVSTSTTDASNTTTSDGEAIAFASGGAGSYTYLWDDPNAQTTATATGLAHGTYNVVVTDSNGCEETEQAVVDAGTVGIETERELFSVYPNPSKGALSINLSKQSHVKVMSILGEKILEQDMASGKHVISTVEWNPGIYLFILEDESGHTDTRKVVVRN